MGMGGLMVCYSSVQIRLLDTPHFLFGGDVFVWSFLLYIEGRGKVLVQLLYTL